MHFRRFSAFLRLRSLRFWDNLRLRTNRNAISGKHRHFSHKCQVMYDLDAIDSGFSRKTHDIYEKIVHCCNFV